MFKPSLHALYKQGRFRKPGFEATSEGMQQVERFAVAMLALALKHEPAFQSDFLKKVCERPQVESEGKFLIELEATGCGDLVLRKEDGSEGYALEFKVNSPIQKHNQDPGDPEFFESGYGAGINKMGWGKSTYILVQNEPAKLRPNEPGAQFKWFGKSWRDVYRCCHDHPLIRDLFESFGSLNIPEFIHMNTKNMSLGRGGSTLEAIKLHELLEAVAGRIGSRSTKLDVQLESDRGYIGMNFLPKNAFAQWKQLVQPRKDIIGWFGYSQEEESTLDVWFYCGNQEAAAHIQTSLEKDFPRRVKSPDQENNVRISLPSGDSAANQEWFISVFESLVQRNQKAKGQGVVVRRRRH